jgi:hypothetical protein
MKTKELISIAQRLSRQGLLPHLTNGDEAIPVSLMITERFIDSESRQKRRELLTQKFSVCLDQFGKSDLEADFNSISVSGQTINAKLAVRKLEAIVDVLESSDIDVRPVVEVQVVSQASHHFTHK